MGPAAVLRLICQEMLQGARNEDKGPRQGLREHNPFPERAPTLSTNDTVNKSMDRLIYTRSPLLRKTPPEDVRAEAIRLNSPSTPLCICRASHPCAQCSNTHHPAGMRQEPPKSRVRPTARGHAGGRRSLWDRGILPPSLCPSLLEGGSCPATCGTLHAPCHRGCLRAVHGALLSLKAAQKA